MLANKWADTIQIYTVIDKPANNSASSRRERRDFPLPKSEKLFYYTGVSMGIYFRRSRNSRNIWPKLWKRKIFHRDFTKKDRNFMRKLFKTSTTHFQKFLLGLRQFCGLFDKLKKYKSFHWKIYGFGGHIQKIKFWNYKNPFENLIKFCKIFSRFSNIFRKSHLLCQKMGDFLMDSFSTFWFL